MSFGLCGCGCGRPTRLAPQSHTEKGWVKGQPLKFINGHCRRKETIRSYRGTTVDGKPVRLHRLIAEKALGKPLPAGAHVHHVDGTTSETSPLVICQDAAYHRLLHARTRILKAGGNPNTDRICCECKRLQSRTDFYGVANQCKDCSARRGDAYRRQNAERLKDYEAARRRTPERQNYMRRRRTAVGNGVSQ